MRIEDFDVQSYLQSRNIVYHTSGDNVSSGWIGINCQFCIDHSDHLGINLQSKGFVCFKCGEHGSIKKLISAIDGVPEEKTWMIIKEFTGGTYVPQEKKFQQKIVLPIGATKKFPARHLEFLRGRCYDQKVVDTYDLYATGLIGKYKLRIIIPVFVNGRMVAFVGRDITGKAPIPYLNSSPEFGTKDVKQCLYNADRVIGDTVLIVEGTLDAWRIGDGAVATFGTKYTKEQVRLLKGMKRVFVLYDADAIPLAYKLAYDLSPFVKETKVIELSKGDPDNFTYDDVRALRKEIGL